MDVIDLALKQSSTKYNITFEYLDKLLTDWHEHGFKTPEQIQKYLINQKNKPKQETAEKKKHLLHLSLTLLVENMMT